MKNLKSMFGRSGKKAETEMEGHGAHQYQHHQNDEHLQTGTKYYCPMHCEGDKLYDSPGKCPVCGMKLVPVGDEKHHGQ